MLATSCLKLIATPDVGRPGFRVYQDTGLSSTGAHS